jgi:hypothetical protein
MASGNKAHIRLVWCNAAICCVCRHQAGVNKIRVEPVWCNTAFCHARCVQPPRSPFSVAPIRCRLPINLHPLPFTSHMSSGHIHPMAPHSPAPRTCATDSHSLLRHAPPVAIDISSTFDTLYIYSLSTTYSIIPCPLCHFTGMHAHSSNPNIQVSNIVY